MTDREGGNTGSVLFAFLLGGLVGAGLTFLLAPQSGPDTRRRISQMADEMREKAEDYAHHARESIDDSVKKSRDYVSEKKTGISTAIDAGKDAYKKEKERYSEEA